MSKTRTQISRESNKRRLKQLCFFLPPVLVDSFKSKAKKEGRSQREIMIELLEKYVK